MYGIDLHHGDCRDVLATLLDCSVDSVVTDPPYALEFMGKRWDTGQVAFDPAFWAEVLRVLKPGGHVLAMGGTRTYHRLACAIEDAGFEIRDTIMWVYGSGFPKSHDVSNGIGIYGDFAQRVQINDPTDSARQWQGWGTALKPAVEPIVLARKPLSEGTVAANVLAHGTGALNVDACRVGTETRHNSMGNPGSNSQRLHGGDGRNAKNAQEYAKARRSEILPSVTGRWPANLIHDGSEEVVAAFPETASGGYPPEGGVRSHVNTYGKPNERGEQRFTTNKGSAARFFYTAKADSDDRLGSKHPTVKPLDLMQYLVRLITPPGGVVLDPFAGTGTTGEAAFREGCRAVLIEREAEYCNDIRRRIALVMAGPDERARERVKAKGNGDDLSDLPLFAASAPTAEWKDMWARPFEETADAWQLPKHLRAR